MKYNRIIKDKYTGQAITVDIYSVLKAFGVTCQAAGHGIKKVLCPGQRGYKGLVKDMEEGIASLQRSVDDIKMEDRPMTLAECEVLIDLNVPTPIKHSHK